MEFTREPIVETIITSKDGCKLVVRNSKGAGQEEYFVDAVEIVTFGGAAFFRSLERPKSFMVPVTDYEILEVRDSRMVLKNVQFEKVKIGGGRDASFKGESDQQKGKGRQPSPKREEEEAKPAAEAKNDRKKDRRRHHRRKRGKEEGQRERASEEGGEPLDPSEYPSLLPPPPSLISETLGLRDKEGQTPPSENPGISASPKKEEVEGDAPSFFRKKGESDASKPSEKKPSEEAGSSDSGSGRGRSDKDQEVHQLGEEPAEKRLDLESATVSSTKEEES